MPVTETGTIAKLDRLIVVAGPSAVGKTSLMGGLQKGKNPWLAQMLEITDPKDYQWIDPARDLLLLPDSNNGKVVLHYDIIKRRYYDLVPVGYGMDPVFKIIDKCREICWLTLWADSNTLVQRIEDRISRISVGGGGNWLRWIHDQQCAQRRKAMYSNRSLVDKIYQKWLTASNGSGKHFFLDVNDLENPVLR